MTPKPLPKKLTQHHMHAQVRITNEARPRILQRCRHADGSYTGAGGLILPKPDDVFYNSGFIVSISNNWCLVAWPDIHSNIGLWLDPDQLERIA